MAYNNAIPQAGDRLKDSQSAILENFAQIKTLIDINHETFGAANGEGKHKHVTFPVQGADPGAAGTDLNLYAKAVGGLGHLFFENASRVTDLSLGTSGSAADVTDLTFSLLAQFDAATPWVVKVGKTNNNIVLANAATTIPYPAAFSSQTGYVIVTPFTGSNISNPLVVQSVAAANFVVYNNSSTAMNIFFLAVGR